jgi:hypothetical protein
MCRNADDDLAPPPPPPRLPAPAPDVAELGVLAALEAEALLLLLLPPPPAGRPRLPPSDTIFCSQERAKKGWARKAAGAVVVNLCVCGAGVVWLGWWYEKRWQKKGDQSSDDEAFANGCHAPAPLAPSPPCGRHIFPRPL